MTLTPGDLVRTRSDRHPIGHRMVGRVVSVQRETVSVQLFSRHRGVELFDKRDVSLWKKGQAIDKARAEARSEG